MTRPTLLTPELQAKVIELTREGLFVETIAGLCGVHRDTIYGWLKRGDVEPDTVFGDFVLAYREAEASAERESLQRIRAPENPMQQTGESFWISRRHRARYAATVRSEVSGPNGKPQQHEHKHTVDAAALALRISQLAARAAAGAAAPPADDGAGDDDAGGADGGPAAGDDGGG